ncbi:transmembrane protein 177 isoform X2 [Cylas formicarius]|uniref:transmembrane protein 177 isoform X2 n=1 Tax=Cylas formicarius TaxID=197179 RepID=UPI0029589A0F|nr:transmembrane protein 177 isoform X2 [Cylas formicarius]
MATKNFLNWLLTEKGKQFSFYVAGTAITGIMVASYTSQTIFINNYKDLFRLYKNGVAAPVPGILKERFEKTLQLLEIEEAERQLYSPFMSCGFDIIGLGLSSSRFGVYIGLPSNFQYNSPQNFDTSKILNQAEGKSVTWDSKEGQDLLNSMVLSEKAQLYAIAKEIQFRQSPKLYIDTFIATSCAAATYILSSIINRKFDFYSRPRVIRLIVYSFVSSLCFMNFIMCKDMSQLYYEKTSDDYLIAKDPVFLEGGKEFWEKILKRNMALRKLLGPRGESMYTITGNENNIIRSKHLPFTERQSFFANKAAPSVN